MKGKRLRSFVPVDAKHLAESIGLPSDETGLPARPYVARAIRKYIGVRRSAELEEVAAWFDTLVAAANYEYGVADARFHSVCRQLAAAGDLAMITSGEKRYLLAVEPTTVKLGLEHDVLLGHLEGAVSVIDADAVVRRTTVQDQSVDLFEHIPPPPWASITVSLGLAEGVRPALILDGIREANPQLSIQLEVGYQPEDLVKLGSPEVRLCILSIREEQVPAVCFRNKNGCDVCLRLEKYDSLAWLYLSQTGIAGVAAWPNSLPMPESVLSILTLLGTPEDDTLNSWNLDDPATEIFSQWLGIPFSPQMPESGDSAQAKIINSPISDRLLVSAGPGSGKTWTACSRIASLIEGGAVPAQILIISFTRAAVAEIRNRIASFLSRPADAYEINIQTLDSLSWSLNAGAGSGGKLSSFDFESGIRSAVVLLEADEDWLLDSLERYQHVVIDEAQDLTGERKSLVLSLLKRLGKTCGVTVFHDPAQSIYHFVEGERAGIEDGLVNLEPAFRRINLNRNYRCKSTKLLDLFAKGRELLDANELGANETYQSIRTGIEEAAEQPGQREARSDERDTFHLYRWRGQLTSAINQALREGRPVRTRLPQHRTLIQPWIAATLSTVIGSSLSEQEFHKSYDDLHPFPRRPANQAWQILRRVCGDERGGVDLRRLAEVMKSNAPLAEIAISDIGPRTAPLFSTIHAAKGREAEVVVLGLPGMARAEEEEKILEEARVLFVGATRASRKLRIAASPRGMKTLSGTSKRNWRGWTGTSNPAAYVEIGRPGDVEAETAITGVGEFEDANFLLWRRSEQISRAVLELKGGSYQVRLASESGGPILGSISAAFTADLRAIGKELTGGKVNPSKRIEGVFIVGSSSVVTSEDPEAPRFSLAPILAGAPLVFLNRS